MNDNLRVKSTVRGEDQLDVVLFRILKVEIKDDGTQDPLIRAVLLLFTINLVCACNSCHVGVRGNFQNALQKQINDIQIFITQR